MLQFKVAVLWFDTLLRTVVDSVRSVSYWRPVFGPILLSDLGFVWLHVRIFHARTFIKWPFSLRTFGAVALKQTYLSF